MADIDSDLILMYEAFLRGRGLTKNSTSFYMRILRAVYNRAVEKDLTTNRNPFKHVYTGIDKTIKRAIPLKAIKQIKNLDLSLQLFLLLLIKIYSQVLFISVPIPFFALQSTWIIHKESLLKTILVLVNLTLDGSFAISLNVDSICFFASFSIEEHAIINSIIMLKKYVFCVVLSGGYKKSATSSYASRLTTSPMYLREVARRPRNYPMVHMI